MIVFYFQNKTWWSLSILLSLHNVYKKKEHFNPLNSRRYYHDNNRMLIFHFFCEQSIILMDPIRAVLPIHHPMLLLKFYSKFFLLTISSTCVLFIFITYLFQRASVPDCYFDIEPINPYETLISLPIPHLYHKKWFTRSILPDIVSMWAFGTQKRR